jgi:hypothetical protein
MLWFVLSDFSVENFDLGEIFGTVATLLIVMGVVLLVISFLGSCGACCKIKCMLLLVIYVLHTYTFSLCYIYVRQSLVLFKDVYGSSESIFEKYRPINFTMLRVPLHLECFSLPNL